MYYLQASISRSAFYLQLIIFVIQCITERGGYMAISLRLSPDEENLIREYASMMNLTVSELVRSSVLEQIEDKLDLELAEEAYEDYLENSVTYSFDQVKKDLGL